MKDTDKKLEFIKARADGKSYSTISKELGIAKATCTSWEHTLRGEIDGLKRARLEELYTAYGMKREARIKALGTILNNLDRAIADKNPDELPLDKLLELRLKYGRELSAEYTEPAELDSQEEDTLEELLEQYNQLYRESRAGTQSAQDIKVQLSVLDAKRDIMYRLSDEYTKEEHDRDFSSRLTYISKLIRQEG